MWLPTFIRDRRSARAAQSLSRAVHALPIGTRRAMLVAIEADQLIVGAYTDRSGRVCPMLAAHRRGARSDVGDFPRAWDTFAGARRPRAATARELEILKTFLEESFRGGPGPTRAEPTVPAGDLSAVRETSAR